MIAVGVMSEMLLWLAVVIEIVVVTVFEEELIILILVRTGRMRMYFQRVVIQHDSSGRDPVVAIKMLCDDWRRNARAEGWSLWDRRLRSYRHTLRARDG